MSAVAVLEKDLEAVNAYFQSFFDKFKDNFFGQYEWGNADHAYQIAVGDFPDKFDDSCFETSPPLFEELAESGLEILNSNAVLRSDKNTENEAGNALGLTSDAEGTGPSDAEWLTDDPPPEEDHSTDSPNG